MTKAPLSWITQVESTLSTLKEIPLWGYPPPFPWEECSQAIGNLLQLPDLSISLKKTELREASQILSGLGESPYHTPLALTPLGETFHWFIPQMDVAKLTQLMLSAQNGIKGFSSPKYQEGFYRYLVLNILQRLDELHPFEDLSLKVAAHEELPSTACLCIDIAIKHSKFSLWGRLVCPPPFIHAFKAHYSTTQSPLQNSPLSKELEVPLKLEVGHVRLTLSEWSKVHTGDVLILERCTYDPDAHKGTVSVVLEQTPLFRARIKENHLKIVDYAYYHEEENTMDHNSDDENEDFEEFEDEDYDDEEDLDEDDEDLDDDDLDDEDDEDEDLEDDEIDEEEKEEEEEAHEEDSEEESSSASETPLWAESTPSEELSETAVATAKIPLTVTIEVARLKMNVDKVLEMNIGNLIELPVRPEQGVHLVINGKRVARGELVKIGEMLGVKILHIGK